MREQTLFDLGTFERYPDAAGYKKRETSREAGEAINAKTLRAKVLKTLDAPLTADECAARMGIDRLAIRPRFSELSRLGKVADSGERRVNASGKRAIVWRRV